MTIKDLGLGVREWRRLSRIDKKALFYFRVLENYYISEAHKKQKKKAEQERKQKENEKKMMANMPRLNMARGKRRG